MYNFPLNPKNGANPDKALQSSLGATLANNSRLTSGGDAAQTYTRYNNQLPASTAPQPGVSSPGALANYAYRSPGTTSAQSIADAQAAAQRAANVAAINAGYDQVNGAYDNIYRNSYDYENRANQTIGDQYNTQLGSLKSGYDRAGVRLADTERQIGDNTKKTLKQLASSIRSTFNSWDTVLGAQGAGDSSATGPNGQLSYALHKVDAQNRGDILSDANEQYTQVGLQRGDLEADFANQKNTLDTWKNTAVRDIQTQFQQQRDQLQAQRAGANQQKLMAIAAADAKLVQGAIASMNQVNATWQGAMQNLSTKVQAPQIQQITMPDIQAQTPQGRGIPGMQVNSQNGNNFQAAAAPLPQAKKYPWS